MVARAKAGTPTAVYVCPTLRMVPLKSKSRNPNSPIGAIAVRVATGVPDVPEPVRRVSWNGIGGSLGQLQVPSHIPIDFKSVLSAVKLWPVGAKITKLRLEPAAPLGGDDNVATTSRHHSQEYRYENRQPFHISPQATCTFPVRSAYEQGRLEEIVSMRSE